MTQTNSSHVGITTSAHTDKILHEQIGLNTSQVVLGLMIVFIVASLSLSYADKQRQSRIHRAVVRVITVAVSIACTALLVLNYNTGNV